MRCTIDPPLAGTPNAMGGTLGVANSSHLVPGQFDLLHPAEKCSCTIAEDSLDHFENVTTKSALFVTLGLTVSAAVPWTPWYWPVPPVIGNPVVKLVVELTVACCSKSIELPIAS